MLMMQPVAALPRPLSWSMSSGRGRKREAAASIIQLNWKKRQAVVKQERYRKETEGTIVSIQSALKAHLVRKRTMLLQNGSSAEPAGGMTGGREVDGEIDGELCESSVHLGGGGEACI